MAIALGNIEISNIAVGSSAATALALGSDVVWQKGTPDWLCFTAKEANSTVRLDKYGSPAEISLETSTDGSTWTGCSWTNTTGSTISLANIGDKVYFRAKNENQTIGSSSPNCYTFVMSGKIAASGNIQTLLKADGSRTDISTTYCYANMFKGCTSLTTAPELPATALANYCYYHMFENCTSLTTAPELPATTLAEGCYQQMFSKCSSLTTAPALLATALAKFCYNGMFENCTSLTTAPELPATTLADYCYGGMFKGCTSLTTAPELPATTLANYCYPSMFNSCTSLNSIEVAFTTWKSNTMTLNWVDGVAATGTFTCPAQLPDTRGNNNIPTGWTKVDAA